MFIVFEGVDGSGKTTQVARLTHALLARDIDTLATSEPIGTELGQHLFGSNMAQHATPLAKAMMFAACRAEHVTTRILPALRDGKTVICDRFTDSSIVYQSYVAGIPPYDIIKLNEMAALHPGAIANLIVYLDIPWETAVARVTARDGIIPSDAEQKVMRKATDAYRQLYYSGRNNDNVKVMRFDGRLPEHVLARDIGHMVLEYIKGK